MDSPEPEVETPPPSLDNLPEELLLKVLRYLPATDLLRFSLTQKRFRALSLDNVLWKGLYASGYPTSYAKHAPRLTSPDANWLELTREAADVAKRFRTGRFHNNITLPGPRDRPSGHSGRVFGVSMLQTSPAHPPHVFSAGDDGYLKLWNLETHECVTSFSNPEDAEGGFFDIRRDMVWGDLKRYFASTFSGRGYILDVFEPGTVTLDGLKAAELKDMLTKRGISSAGCFEKSDLISRIKEFKVDQSSWRIVKRAELGYHMAPCVTIRGYGNTLAFTCSFDGTVQVYSLADMTEPSATAPSQAPLKLSPIMHYAHSRSNTYAINAVVYDGKFMYTSGNDGEIHMSDLGATSIEYGAIPSPTRHRVLNGVNGHRHWIWCLESPKEHMLVSGSVDRWASFSSWLLKGLPRAHLYLPPFLQDTESLGRSRRHRLPTHRRSLQRAYRRPLHKKMGRKRRRHRQL